MGFLEELYPDLFADEPLMSQEPRYPGIFQSSEADPTNSYSMMRPLFSSQEEQMPSLFPSEASVSPSPFSYSPVDNSSIFKTLAESASEAVTGVTAQQEKLRSQLDELDAAPNGNGSIGAAIFGGLAGALAGGSASQIAQAAGSVGQSHVNNLEANAKEKKLRLVTQLAELEKRRTDAIGQAQAVEIAGLNSQVQDQRDLSQGKVVGSPEWEREKANRRQEIGLATGNRQQGSALDRPLSAEEKQAWIQKFREKGLSVDPATLNAQRDIDRNLELVRQTSIDARQEKGFDYNQGKLELPNAKISVNPKTNTPYLVDTTEHTAAMKIGQAVSAGTDAVRGMYALTEKNGGKPIVGNDVTEFEALSSSLFTAIRGFSGTGANLTENEKELVQAFNVSTYNDGLRQVLVDYIRKGDTLEQLKSLDRVITQVGGANMKALKYDLDGYTPAPEIPMGGDGTKKSISERLAEIRGGNGG